MLEGRHTYLGVVSLLGWRREASPLGHGSILPCHLLQLSKGVLVSQACLLNLPLLIILHFLQGKIYLLLYYGFVCTLS